MRSLIIRYREPQSWNGTDVSSIQELHWRWCSYRKSKNIGFWRQRGNNKRNGHIKSPDYCKRTYCRNAILCNHLKMRRVADKVEPKLLTFEQKSIRQSISEDILSRVNSDDTFLKRIITGDETWIYGYDMEIKIQSNQWIFLGKPRPKKARKCRSNVKVLLISFFDWQGGKGFKP